MLSGRLHSEKISLIQITRVGMFLELRWVRFCYKGYLAKSEEKEENFFSAVDPGLMQKALHQHAWPGITAQQRSDSLCCLRA